MASRTLVEIVADNIRAYRTTRGLSQKALAELMELDQSHLSKIENGSLMVSLDVLDRLAQALKIPTYVLLKSDHTEDLPLWEKLRKIDELDQEKRNILLKMLDAFLHEKELLDKKQEKEEKVVKELKEIRQKKIPGKE